LQDCKSHLKHHRTTLRLLNDVKQKTVEKLEKVTKRLEKPNKTKMRVSPTDTDLHNT